MEDSLGDEGVETTDTEERQEVAQWKDFFLDKRE